MVTITYLIGVNSNSPDETTLYVLESRALFMWCDICRHNIYLCVLLATNELLHCVYTGGISVPFFSQLSHVCA